MQLPPGATSTDDVFRHFFGPDFHISEMRTQEVFISNKENEFLLDLLKQGIPVAGPGAPFTVLRHEWHGQALYAGPDYDTFIRGRDAGIFPLVPITGGQLTQTLNSFGANAA